MATIAYQYLSFEFKRPPLAPLNMEEYLRVKSRFEPFLASFLEKAEAEFRKQKNPHSFRWKPFLILAGAGGIFIAVDLILKAMGHFDAGEVFSVLAFFPLAAVLVQPLQWFLSFMRSSSFSDYEEKVRAYYCFHEKKAKASSDYEDYRRIISETSLSEFEAFQWSL